MGCRIAYRHDKVASIDQGCQTVDVVEIINLIDVLKAQASLGLKQALFLSSVAVLQIHELDIRQGKDRRQIVETDTLAQSEILVRAEPGQSADHFVFGQALPQMPAARLIGKQIGGFDPPEVCVGYPKEAA